MADSQDAIELKRRARRRLVGAIALVVFVVIALPIVLDREPKPVSQDLSIQIPSQDAGRFSSRVLPAEPPAAPVVPSAEAAKPEAKAGDIKVVQSKPVTPAPVIAETQPAKPSAPQVKPEAKSEAKPEATVAAKVAPEQKPAATAAAAVAPSKDAAKTAAATEAKPAAAATDGAFVVPLGLFSKADNIKQVRAKAASAGFKTYTEAVAGTDRVRVRAGPFASREAADQARDKLKGAGLDVGAVSAR